MAKFLVWQNFHAVLISSFYINIKLLTDKDKHRVKHTLMTEAETDIFKTAIKCSK